MKLAISSCVIELVQSASKQARPNEACGLLFGTTDRIGRATIAANVAPDPRRHFEIDPAALFVALRAERAGGERLAGYWHSHPSGIARPSATDLAMAAPDGRLWLIEADGELTAWRAPASPGDTFRPVDWVID
ncbi:M67 family metallopeptidase [Sphingomonas turrisvirgatae]|uniref:JAB domain-containing protein n=1 Tax=Sphingomonas turrisvirgatae TaxID=1888892 RepID=A0A1E3LX40_9SPHN|nr:M67 family metallopeptidase [Sphingomonas turrisvirgatae]ODP37380.1 hypothetical protein BFL28_18365 [Sphingomonas turrisvirgatae]